MTDTLDCCAQVIARCRVRHETPLAVLAGCEMKSTMTVVSGWLAGCVVDADVLLVLCGEIQDFCGIAFRMHLMLCIVSVLVRYLKIEEYATGELNLLQDAISIVHELSVTC